MKTLRNLISSGNVNVDLSKGQSFNLNVDEAVTGFTIINPPAEATAFTIKDHSRINCLLSWYRYIYKQCSWIRCDSLLKGGNVPIVTQVAGKTDIFSFKSFDACIALFGIVGGQNFSN